MHHNNMNNNNNNNNNNNGSTSSSSNNNTNPNSNANSSNHPISNNNNNDTSNNNINSGIMDFHPFHPIPPGLYNNNNNHPNHLPNIPNNNMNNNFHLPHPSQHHLQLPLTGGMVHPPFTPDLGLLDPSLLLHLHQQQQQQQLGHLHHHFTPSPFPGDLNEMSIDPQLLAGLTLHHTLPPQPHTLPPQSATSAFNDLKTPPRSPPINASKSSNNTNATVSSPSNPPTTSSSSSSSSTTSTSNPHHTQSTSLTHNNINNPNNAPLGASNNISSLNTPKPHGTGLQSMTPMMGTPALGMVTPGSSSVPLDGSYIRMSQDFITLQQDFHRLSLNQNSLVQLLIQREQKISQLEDQCRGLENGTVAVGNGSGGNGNGNTTSTTATTTTTAQPTPFIPTFHPNDHNNNNNNPQPTTPMCQNQSQNNAAQGNNNNTTPGTNAKPFYPTSHSTQQIEDLERAIAGLKQQAQQHSHEFKMTRLNINELRSGVEGFDQRLEQQSATLLAALPPPAPSLDPLQNKLEALQNEHQASDKRLEQYKTDQTKMSNQITSVQQLITNLQQQYQTQQGTINSQQSFIKSHSHFESIITQTQLQQDRIVEQHNKYKKDFGTFTSQSAEMNKTFKELSSANETMTKQVADLVKTVEDHTRIISNLLEENNTLRSKIVLVDENQTKANSKHKTQYATLHERLEQAAQTAKRDRDRNTSETKVVTEFMNVTSSEMNNLLMNTQSFDRSLAQITSVVSHDQSILIQLIKKDHAKNKFALREQLSTMPSQELRRMFTSGEIVITQQQFRNYLDYMWFICEPEQFNNQKPPHQGPAGSPPIDPNNPNAPPPNNTPQYSFGPNCKILSALHRSPKFKMTCLSPIYWRASMLANLTPIEYYVFLYHIHHNVLYEDDPDGRLEMLFSRVGLPYVIAHDNKQTISYFYLSYLHTNTKTAYTQHSLNDLIELILLQQPLHPLLQHFHVDHQPNIFTLTQLLEQAAELYPPSELSPLDKSLDSEDEGMELEDDIESLDGIPPPPVVELLEEDDEDNTGHIVAGVPLPLDDNEVEEKEEETKDNDDNQNAGDENDEAKIASRSPSPTKKSLDKVTVVGKDDLYVITSPTKPSGTPRSSGSARSSPSSPSSPWTSAKGSTSPPGSPLTIVPAPPPQTPPPTTTLQQTHSPPPPPPPPQYKQFRSSRSVLDLSHHQVLIQGSTVLESQSYVFCSFFHNLIGVFRFITVLSRSYCTRQGLTSNFPTIMDTFITQMTGKASLLHITIYDIYYLTLFWAVLLYQDSFKQSAKQHPVCNSIYDCIDELDPNISDVFAFLNDPFYLLLTQSACDWDIYSKQYINVLNGLTFQHEKMSQQKRRFLLSGMVKVNSLMQFATPLQQRIGIAKAQVQTLQQQQQQLFLSQQQFYHQQQQQLHHQLNLQQQLSQQQHQVPFSHQGIPEFEGAVPPMHPSEFPSQPSPYIDDPNEIVHRNDGRKDSNVAAANMLLSALNGMDFARGAAGNVTTRRAIRLQNGPNESRPAGGPAANPNPGVTATDGSTHAPVDATPSATPSTSDSQTLPPSNSAPLAIPSALATAVANAQGKSIGNLAQIAADLPSTFGQPLLEHYLAALQDGSNEESFKEDLNVFFALSAFPELHGDQLSEEAIQQFAANDAAAAAEAAAKAKQDKDDDKDDTTVAVHLVEASSTAATNTTPATTTLVTPAAAAQTNPQKDQSLSGHFQRMDRLDSIMDHMQSQILQMVSSEDFHVIKDDLPAQLAQMAMFKEAMFSRTKFDSESGEDDESIGEVDEDGKTRVGTKSAFIHSILNRIHMLGNLHNLGQPKGQRQNTPQRANVEVIDDDSSNATSAHVTTDSGLDSDSDFELIAGNLKSNKTLSQMQQDHIDHMHHHIFPWQQGDLSSQDLDLVSAPHNPPSPSDPNFPTPLQLQQLELHFSRAHGGDSAAASAAIAGVFGSGSAFIVPADALEMETAKPTAPAPTPTATTSTATTTSTTSSSNNNNNNKNNNHNNKSGKKKKK